VPDHTYVFIDGEYLRRTHREAMQQFFGLDGELELSPIMRQAEASRVYFYDAIDHSLGAKETAEEYQARVIPLERFFSYLQSLSGFHVRPGSVSRGKRRQQKEVDVLLATDMLTHGFNGSMGKAVLIAGDVDFRPVVEALVQHGVFVHVWYHRSSFAQELPGAADFGYEIRFRDLYEWNSQSFKDSHHIPSEHWQAGDRGGLLVGVGSIGGWRVELREHRNPAERSWFYLWIDTGRLDSLVVRDPDVELLERYVAVQFGPVNWEAKGEEIRVVGGGA
jgi:uncharacterized LabA/DUF88 family protein